MKAKRITIPILKQHYLFFLTCFYWFSGQLKELQNRCVLLLFTTARPWVFHTWQKSTVQEKHASGFAFHAGMPVMCEWFDNAETCFLHSEKGGKKYKDQCRSTHRGQIKRKKIPGKGESLITRSECKFCLSDYARIDLQKRHFAFHSKRLKIRATIKTMKVFHEDVYRQRRSWTGKNHHGTYIIE